MTEYHLIYECQACGFKAEYRGPDNLADKADIFAKSHRCQCSARRNISFWDYLFNLDIIDVIVGILLTGLAVSMVIASLK